jgi:hypothetical protein
MLQGPIAFDVSARPLKAAPKPPESGHPQGTPTPSVPTQSMEARIKELLRTLEPVTPKSAQEWMEHLAILKRWYYRTSKVGEIFFEDEAGVLPMRRVVRAVGRVFKGEKPAADLSETAGDYWIFRSKEAGL